MTSCRHTSAARSCCGHAILEPWGLDNMKAAFIGSAPPPQDVIVYFLALGVPLLEAYGLTEATGFGAIWPRLDDFRLGTVGKPAAGRRGEDRRATARSCCAAP